MRYSRTYDLSKRNEGIKNETHNNTETIGRLLYRLRTTAIVIEIFS